jgi:hypothetical protein
VRHLRRLDGRRAALLAAAAVVVASASVAIALMSGGGHPAGSAGVSSCPLSIRFGDAHYLGRSVKRTLRLGRHLGRAIVDSCPDSGIFTLQTREAPGGGAVVAIRGIPPSVAVGAAAQRHTAYVAYGYFPELPSYPLHEGRAPDYTRGCRVTGRFSLVGRVRLHSSALVVEVDRSSGSLVAGRGATFIQLLVDARTRIEGFERNGLPYIAAGDPLRSSGVTCQFPGPHSPAVVARTIAPTT